MDGLIKLGLIGGLGLAAITAFAVLLPKKKRNSKKLNKVEPDKDEKIRATGRVIKRDILKNSEIRMFNLMCKALPSHLFNIWPQVSFQALIDAEKGSETGFRNTFDKKVVDFVLVRSNMEVVCIIELDDWSHKGREDEDAKREKLLTDAGYRVVRFGKMPKIDEFRKEIFN